MQKRFPRDHKKRWHFCHLGPTSALFQGSAGYSLLLQYSFCAPTFCSGDTLCKQDNENSCLLSYGNATWAKVVGWEQQSHSLFFFGGSWPLPSAPSVQCMKSLCFWSQDFSVLGLNLLATAQQSRCKEELGATSPKGWSQQGHKNTLPASVRGLHRQRFQALAQDAAVLRCPGTG